MEEIVSGVFLGALIAMFWTTISDMVHSWESNRKSAISFRKKREAWDKARLNKKEGDIKL